MEKLKRIPNHIGIIPDGNRRWALANGMGKQDGYRYGVEPGFKLYELCVDLGIKELTFYGFTVDNTKRPSNQIKEFQKACIDSVQGLMHRDANLLIIGNTNSPLFPEELLPYTSRTKFGKGLININFLVNYSWSWDLNCALKSKNASSENLIKNIASCDISRMDLILRWGGRRRLSGFLPIQSIYSDFYIYDEMWPDYNNEQVISALRWYQDTDITLGG